MMSEIMSIKSYPVDSIVYYLVQQGIVKAKFELRRHECMIDDATDFEIKEIQDL